MILKSNAEAFALWLAHNQPEVFEGALRAAQGKSVPRSVSNLAGISDVLSSFGTSFTTAVKSVGSFVASPQGMATIGTIGGMYLQSQAQKDALKLQVATIKAGYPPQPVTNSGYNTNSAVPIYGPTGEVLTSQLANQLTPSASLMNYAPWILITLGAGYLLFKR